MNQINLSGLDEVFSQAGKMYQTVQGVQLQGVAISAIVLLVIGLLSCFLGFRLTKLVSALVGAAAGGVLCAFVAMSYLPESFGFVGTAIIAIVGALLIGYLFYHLYYVMVFLICAGAGAVIGSVPAMAAGLGSLESGTTVFYVIILVCALLFGAAGVLFFKPVVIVLTSFGGFLAAFQLSALGVTLGSRMTLVVGAVLTVAGIFIQFATCRKRSKPGFRRIRSITPEGTEEGADGSPIQYQEIDETPDAPRLAADELYDSLSQNGFVRFLMAISPVLAIASAIAIIVLGSVHYELVLIFAFLCYAGRRRKSLVITFLLLLIYSLYQLVAGGFPTTGELTSPTGILNIAASVLFLILFLLALVSDRRAHPKKQIRRVPIEETDDATAPMDHLEETRPLTAEEVDNAFAGTQDIEATRPMTEGDTQTFEPMAPQEFRETQETIFGEETAPAAESEPQGMEAEPDDAEASMDETRRI